MRRPRPAPRAAVARAARALAAAVLAAGAAAGCSSPDRARDDAFHRAPVLERTVTLTADGSVVRPSRIELLADTLYVVEHGTAAVYRFAAGTFEDLGTVRLRADEPVTPGDLAVTPGAFVIGDHARGVIGIFDREGSLRDGFGLLPDGSTRITPRAVTETGGVLYVADCSTGRVLAVSLTDVPGLTQFGELILSVPALDHEPLPSPCSVFVTPDGRLLIGDAREGAVRVHTCDGRFVYRFDPLPGRRLWLPRALAMDGVADPGMQDPETFDPSGIREQGRIHVVDGQNGRIHMFNSLGHYVSSYPADRTALSDPSDIVVDRTRRRVILCDPPADRLVVFGYDE